MKSVEEYVIIVTGTSQQKVSMLHFTVITNYWIYKLFTFMKHFVIIILSNYLPDMFYLLFLGTWYNLHNQLRHKIYIKEMNQLKYVSSFLWYILENKRFILPEKKKIKYLEIW